MEVREGLSSRSRHKIILEQLSESTVSYILYKDQCERQGKICVRYFTV